MKQFVVNTLLRGAVALGYDAAQTSRNRRDLGFSRRQNRDEDRLIGGNDLSLIRQKCYDLRRNNGIINSICGTFQRNVVSTGITPQAKTSSKDWNQEAEDFWREWCKIADNRNRASFNMIQRMICDSRLLSGDMGFLLLDNGKIQPIEADRIETPTQLSTEKNIFNGIRIDGNGQPVEYYIFRRNAQGVIDKSSADYDTIQAENVIYICNPFRFDQIRGIPELTSVLTNIQDIVEISEATLTKAKLDAMKGWAVYTESGSAPLNTGRFSDRGAGAPQYERFEVGQNYYLGKGEKIESLASNTPSNQYMPYMEHNLRLIGAATGLPYEFVSFDYSKGNFSSTKASLLQAYQTFTSWQEWITTQFLQRIWNWRISKAVKYGDISRPPIDSKGRSEFWRVQWQYPEFSWVNPEQQSAANLADYNMGVTTLTAITRKSGRDFEDVATEKASDIALASQIADETNKKYGTNLTWHDIINTDTIANQQANTKDELPLDGDNQWLM